jgi:hypothetical protein
VGGSAAANRGSHVAEVASDGQSKKDHCSQSSPAHCREKNPFNGMRNAAMLRGEWEPLHAATAISRAKPPHCSAIALAMPGKNRERLVA